MLFHDGYCSRMTVGIYARISKDREGEGLGVERQVKECREKAESLGWTVDKVYVDNDISAYQRRKPRPQYEQLLKDIASRTVDRLIVWHVDRLHRHNAELERFLEVAGEDFEVHAVTSSPLDLATPSGRMAARILGSVAQYESEQKAKRQRSRARQDAERGVLKKGGTRGFGYEKDGRTVREEEAALLREAGRRVLLGASLRGICREWNEAGIKTVTGKPWTSPVLRGMLLRPKNAGLREHKGVILAEGDWGTIFTREEHGELRAVLTDPTRRTNGGSFRRTYLLTGLLYCGQCGSRMMARPTGDHARSYVCASSTLGTGIKCYARVQAEPLEEMVREAVLHVFDTQDFGKALGGTDTEQAMHKQTEEVRRLEKAVAELEDDYRVHGIITRQDYLNSRERLVARRDSAQHELSGMVRQAVGVGDWGDLRAMWSEQGHEWHRAVVESVVERVVVGAGRRGYNRFDPSRVKIEWRS